MNTKQSILKLFMRFGAQEIKSKVHGSFEMKNFNIFLIKLTEFWYVMGLRNIGSGTQKFWIQYYANIFWSKYWKFKMSWDLENFALCTQKVWIYYNILWLKYWKLKLLWDLENFTLGTQMLCNEYYSKYVETFIVFLNLEGLALCARFF